MSGANWAWGLWLIALTIAIHVTGVVMITIGALRIRLRVGMMNLGLWQAILIVIGDVGAVGLLLAVLHGIETMIWAAAYVWLGALASPNDAILYSLELDDDARCFGAESGTALADHGSAEVGQRHAAVRY